MAVSVPGASAAPAIAAAGAMASSPRIVGVPATKEFGGIRRSWSEPQLRCSVIVPRAAALKKSRSMGVFPFSISGSILPGSIRSFLFDSDDARGEMRLVDAEEGDEEAGSEEEEEEEEEGEGDADEKAERTNWVERLLEVRTRWRDRKQREEDNANEEEEEEEEGDEADYYCGVSYDAEYEEEEGESKVSDRIAEWDRDSFSKLLVRVPWSDAMLFSQLAHLSNLAYVIPEIKAAELRKWYDLRFVTSSLEKKAEAAAVVAKLELDSTRPGAGPARSDGGAAEPKRPVRPAVAYDIAASAAAYVHSRAKGLLSLGGARSEGFEEEDDDDVAGCSAAPYKSEVAAYVAASTMTSVVAAEEAARREAAKDLRSLHSSPCEWFVCDEPATHTRCFVIQGSDSLASWQANLLFEPTKFENTGVPVHRGIYEAAKGIYDQLWPEIEAHLKAHGDRAMLRFTGHSLGGSLAVLVSLMLLARGDVGPGALHPVVTFGTPSVFCGGQRVLERLGVGEGHVRAVMIHRDIVPRAFSCSYPGHVALVLKRLNGAFRSHPCLNNEKVLYSPLGRTYILQPDEKSSPPHPFLPGGAALYALRPAGGAEGGSSSANASALRAFLNTPHPLETLSDPKAYGSEGAILRDHDSSNYAKAISALLKQHTRSVVRRSLPRAQRLHHWWPLLTRRACPGSNAPVLETRRLVAEELVTGA